MAKAAKTRRPSNTKQGDPAPAPEFASDTDLARRYSVSRASIWRWSKEGIIPKPQKLGPNCTRWRLAGVVDALEGEEPAA